MNESLSESSGSSEVKEGLEGVYACESSIATIDGKNGILRYRGYNINELAEKSTYEEVAYLLLYGELPKKQELKEFSLNLKSQRDIPKDILKIMKIAAEKKQPPMDFLRTSVSMLSAYDENVNNLSRESLLEKSINLIAKMPTILAYYNRIRNNQKIIKPKKSLSHAANFLYMLKGEVNEMYAKVMDVCFILHAEHELNASSFSARVTASSLSDIYSAITSAIGTLKGAWHGGANERVLEILEKINNKEEATNYLQKMMEKKERIMGFGHRIYKAKDPRAYILEKYSQQLAEQSGGKNLYEISKAIEQFMMQPKFTEKGIFPNVDFYSASVYHYLGIQKDLFTPIFAASRTAGWCAQVLEQYNKNRIFRPLSKYIGHENRSYVQIGRR